MPRKVLREEHTAAYDNAMMAFNASEPVVSVVLASYNQAQYIVETLESVVKQSFTNWEMVIVDDGSSDDSWEKVKQFMGRHANLWIRAVQKENGGLADARNTGLTYARGDWLCMLDSDDLLVQDYLRRVTELAKLGADIVPGCMENFDAVSSIWCFPEGWSIVGISNWNKFHAAVPMRRTLMERVGGYDPGIPWGLEDWNFWLGAAVYNPAVKFVPEKTFMYRHHKGTSMRKKMFALALEETKAIVRTNHPTLYEPVQLLGDHRQIAQMRPETLERLEEKILKFPELPQPYFWRGLARMEAHRHQEAVDDFVKSAALLERVDLPNVSRNRWQLYYHLSLGLEALQDWKRAFHAIGVALTHAYFDEILSAHHRIASHVDGAPGPHLKALPTYWGEEGYKRKQERFTVAGKLQLLESIQASGESVAGSMRTAVALLKGLKNIDCSRHKHQDGKAVNLVRNPHFEEKGAATNAWAPFGDRPFALASMAPRPRGSSGRSLKLVNEKAGAVGGAHQVVNLNQAVPEAVLVQAWSKAQDVDGARDDGYSIYIDIKFQDGSNEWSFTMPFSPGTHDWELQRAYIDRRKPIKSLDLYCILRNHVGTAYFDDVSVAPLSQAACHCGENEQYLPTSGRGEYMRPLRREGRRTDWKTRVRELPGGEAVRAGAPVRGGGRLAEPAPADISLPLLSLRTSEEGERR